MSSDRPPRVKEVLAMLEVLLEGDPAVGDVSESGRAALAERLEGLEPEELAEVLVDIEPDKRILIFEALPRDEAAVLLEETDRLSTALLLRRADNEVLREVAAEMGPDEVADLVDLLDEEEARTFVGDLDPATRAQVNELLPYPADTAGGQMTTQYVAVPPDATAGDVLQILRGAAAEAETIQNIYVINDDRRLDGVVSIRDVLAARDDLPVREFMEDDVVFTDVHADQEEVAQLLGRYNLAAIPVVDAAHRLRGIVTFDDIIDVIREESDEDAFRQAGSLARDPFSDHVFRRAMNRTPFLMVTMLGGAGAAAIMMLFGASLEESVLTAAFVPLIIGMAGNVGIQSSTLVVRGLATGTFGVQRLWRELARELGTALILAVIFSSLVLALVTGLQRWGPADWMVGVRPEFGMFVAGGMFAAIAMAALVGLLVPTICERLDIDPALAAGPFVTTINDLVGLSAYLGITSSLSA